MANIARRAREVARTEGLRGVGSRVLLRLGARLEVRAPMRQEVSMLVRTEDALAVDWTRPPDWSTAPPPAPAPSYSVAWIMSPPGESSGGHQNLLRFMRFMEDAGHAVTVYLYSSGRDPIDIDGVRTMLATSPSYARIGGPIRLLTGEGVAPGTDAIFATGWETAYPSFLDRSPARRFYFVQDFEPAFYPMGSEYVLAENTYRFGFRGVTAGHWLPHKLADYGMVAEPFDFGADAELYHHVNDARRNEILFYARPVTARRGFELGLLVLGDFARRRPDVTINLAGWDVSDWHVPFPHRNLTSLPITELNALYNRCAAGLVLSLTNMSLLPLELLASGVIPVLNKGDNNTMVSGNPFIEYAEASPAAMATKLADVVGRPDLPAHARAAAASVEGSGWQHAAEQFVEIFERGMRG